jgi:hypothetical protein
LAGGRQARLTEKGGAVLRSFGWGARKDAAAPGPATPSAAPEAGTVTTSKVLPRFLSLMAAKGTPVVMDLGAVVGANIAFFGEQLGCKIFIEDLFGERERQLGRGVPLAPGTLAGRLAHPDESIDGILCWDLFDFLDRPASTALATRLVALLKPGGAVYGFFGSVSGDITHHTRFIVESKSSLRWQPMPAAPTRRNVLVTRDVNKLFAGLTVAESVLLKSNTRESLFRKP